MYVPNLFTNVFFPSGDVKINNRPNVNSILHLFGGWLFEAAFIGNEDLLPMKGRVSTVA